MIDGITGLIEKLGYWGVAFLMLLENFIPPLPSEVIVPLAGYVAAQGKLDFWLVVVAASSGGIAGASGWYLIARSIGSRRLRRWMDAHGHWLTLSCRDIDKAQAWFDRHGRWAVLAGRLVPGVRTFVSLPAGFAEMPFVSFLVYTTIGTVIWTLGLAWAGTLLQSRFDVIGEYVDHASRPLLAAFVVYLAWRYVKVFRARAAS